MKSVRLLEPESSSAHKSRKSQQLNLLSQEILLGTMLLAMKTWQWKIDVKSHQSMFGLLALLKG